MQRFQLDCLWSLSANIPSIRNSGSDLIPGALDELQAIYRDGGSDFDTIRFFRRETALLDQRTPFGVRSGQCLVHHIPGYTYGINLSPTSASRMQPDRLSSVLRIATVLFFTTIANAVGRYGIIVAMLPPRVPLRTISLTSSHPCSSHQASSPPRLSCS